MRRKIVNYNNLIDEFIESNSELIYQKYCEIFPELIHSDFTIENIQDIEDFINTFMEREIEKFKNLRRKKNDKKSK